MTASANIKDFDDLVITPTDWQVLAEFYAVMKVMNVLAMTSQKQTVDANCFSYYGVAYARYMIESATTLKVIDFSGQFSPSTELSKVPLITLEIHQLNPLTQSFMQRLVKEFDFYFKAPDGDQTKMMIFHPVMVWRGLE
jgi:hypothetical protein